MTDFDEGSVTAEEVRGKQFSSVRGLNNWLKHNEDTRVYGVETLGEGSYALFYRPESTGNADAETDGEESSDAGLP